MSDDNERLDTNLKRQNCLSKSKTEETNVMYCVKLLHR